MYYYTKQSYWPVIYATNFNRVICCSPGLEAISSVLIILQKPCNLETYKRSMTVTIICRVLYHGWQNLWWVSLKSLYIHFWSKTILLAKKQFPRSSLILTIDILTWFSIVNWTPHFHPSKQQFQVSCKSLFQIWIQFSSFYINLIELMSGNHMCDKTAWIQKATVTLIFNLKYNI